jgi:hypothetical protein
VLVPIATIVSPIIDSESPHIFAISTDPVTRSFPPMMRIDMPPMIQSHAFQVFDIISISSDSSGIKLLCITE